MANPEKPSNNSNAKREAKLADALRANLRRRKVVPAPREPAPLKPKSVDET